MSETAPEVIVEQAPETPASDVQIETPEVQAQAPQISLTDFSTKLGREFKDVGEVYKTIEDLQKRPEKLPEEKPSSPFVGKISQLLDEVSADPTKAKEIADFVNFQFKDFANEARKDPRGVLFVAEKSKNQGFTDEEIKQKIDLEFPILTEDDEPDDAKRERINRESEQRAKFAALDKVNDLNKLKVEIGRPDAAQLAEQEKNRVKTIFDNHKNQADQFLKEFTEVKVGDYAHSIKFFDEKGAPTDTYKSVQPFIEDPLSLPFSLMNQDGSPKTREILQVATILAEYGRIAKGMATWGASEANKVNRDELENREKTPGTDKKPASNLGGNDGTSRLKKFYEKQNK